jgi:hypothetical protein
MGRTLMEEAVGCPCERGIEEGRGRGRESEGEEVVSSLFFEEVVKPQEKEPHFGHEGGRHGEWMLCPSEALKPNIRG